MGSPYDYESMMHYGKGYFAKSSGLITIQTLDPKYQNVIGQRKGFSQGDIEQFNKMYNCLVPSTKTSPQKTVATAATAKTAAATTATTIATTTTTTTTITTTTTTTIG